MSLTFDLWPNQYVPGPGIYSLHDLILVKLAQIFTILFSPSFWVITCSDLDLWPQNLISTSTNPNTLVTKTAWVKFPSLFSEIWCSRGFRNAQTHALTHPLTDGQTMQFSNSAQSIPCTKPYWRSDMKLFFLMWSKTVFLNNFPWGCSGRARNFRLGG